MPLLPGLRCGEVRSRSSAQVNGRRGRAPSYPFMIAPAVHSLRTDAESVHGRSDLGRAGVWDSCNRLYRAAGILSDHARATIGDRSPCRRHEGPAAAPRSPVPVKSRVDSLLHRSWRPPKRAFDGRFLAFAGWVCSERQQNLMITKDLRALRSEILRDHGSVAADRRSNPSLHDRLGLGRRSCA
jgi:hypothetical protein